MKVEVGKFGDGRSLKVLVRFEEASNFWADNSTWVPKIEEVKHILEALLAVDEYNKLKKAVGTIHYEIK